MYYLTKIMICFMKQAIQEAPLLVSEILVFYECGCVCGGFSHAVYRCSLFLHKAAE